jgi:hypothetical protein
MIPIPTEETIWVQICLKAARKAERQGLHHRLSDQDKTAISALKPLRYCKYRLIKNTTA